jgi:hypothetical protein
MDIEAPRGFGAISTASFKRVADHRGFKLCEVWMIWERDHQLHRVYLDRAHSPNPKPSWFGESVGHYENGQLVVDTIGFIEHPLSFVDNLTTPHTKDLHVVERWKIGDGGNALEARG